MEKIKKINKDKVNKNQVNKVRVNKDKVEKKARLEAAVSDMLEVRLNAAADLDIDVEPPAAALPANTADGEPPRSGWAWRTERADGKPVAGSGARLSVRRKLQQVRATQRLGVEFTADGVRLQLRAGQ